MVDDLNSLKIIGSAELQERPVEEVIHLFYLSKKYLYNIILVII
jgi:hypothetical protein